jgi:glycosyltransferase involved in cell wall biosynthesis
MNESIELTILMPCLNEAETLESCIRQAHSFLRSHSIAGEIIIADNGSTDGSIEIANANGARVIHVANRGYGAALIGGIAAASGRFVAMGDADDSYDFGSLMPFVEKLRAGADLVMGNRFAGGIAPGAMPALHRLVGNPILSFLGRLFFKIKVRDFHCGLRAFRRESILGLGLQTSGMEFASEMVVKSSLNGLQLAEVPTPLRKDGRSRPPHLRSFRDGWRHLRFLLIFSPRWLLLYPGIATMIVGLLATTLLLFGPRSIGTIGFDVGTLLYGVALTIIGYQAVLFAVLSRVYAQEEGFLPRKPGIEAWQRRGSIEGGALAGLLILICGFAASLASLARWRSAGYGNLNPSQTVRGVVPALLGLTLGSQTLLGGAFLSILRIRTSQRDRF